MFTTNQKLAAAGGAVVLLIVIVVVIIFVTKKDSTTRTTTPFTPTTTPFTPTTTPFTPTTTPFIPTTTRLPTTTPFTPTTMPDLRKINITYTDVIDGPHRIIGNDFYFKGAFDKPFATGKWIGPNEYAVFISQWRGWILMQIANNFTMKTAWKLEESTYVPTVADIATLTTGRPALRWS